MNIYEELDIFCGLFLKEAKKKKHKPWSKGHRPKGWDAGSVKQYSNSLIGGEKHPFTECMKKMKGKIDNPEGFCQSVKMQNKKK